VSSGNVGNESNIHKMTFNGIWLISAITVLICDCDNFSAMGMGISKILHISIDESLLLTQLVGEKQQGAMTNAFLAVHGNRPPPW
jgi:hypothetical protein